MNNGGKLLTPRPIPFSLKWYSHMFAHGPSRVLPSYSALLEQKSRFGCSATITSLTKNSLPLLESFDGLVGIAESICDLPIGTEPYLPLFYLIKSKWRG